MKIVLFQTIQFSISMQFKCKYGLIVKIISISTHHPPTTYKHTYTSIHKKIYEHYSLYICYLSSCDKGKLFVFLTFLFLSIFFRLRLFVQIVLYIL